MDLPPTLFAVAPRDPRAPTAGIRIFPSPIVSRRIFHAGTYVAFNPCPRLNPLLLPLSPIHTLPVPHTVGLSYSCLFSSGQRSSDSR
ncbi:hypothetical protein CRG98_046291 [Punica granatum]|uniref:Uncharacterized protein n=1 Tax=Punica granatum TaxID=22663 RepID=A0A2I0HPW6_PUNGR|nr:hypothetical protein CRG98_046291 [Punica granatum]